jgi:hypothetical protein
MLGNDFCFTINRERRGVIQLFFRILLSIALLLIYSQNHGDVEVVDSGHGNWKLIGYYGFLEGGRRRAAWNFLKQLSQTYVLLWCIEIFASDHYPIICWFMTLGLLRAKSKQI